MVTMLNKFLDHGGVRGNKDDDWQPVGESDGENAKGEYSASIGKQAVDDAEAILDTTEYGDSHKVENEGHEPGKCQSNLGLEHGEVCLVHDGVNDFHVSLNGQCDDVVC